MMLRPAVLMLCIAAQALPGQSKLSKPAIDTVNKHIVRVMNSGPTAWTDTNGWKLVYERTVQPKDGTPGELGNPSAALLLDDGRLIETETAHAVIRLFDGTGHFVREISRIGDGPGEFRYPNPMLFHDTLVIHDPRLRRGTLYTMDGKTVRSVTTVCCSFGDAYFIDDRGRMFLRGLGNGPAGQWVVVDVTGRRIDSLAPPLAAPPHQWTVLNANGQPQASVNIPYAGQTARTVLHDGAILYGATDSYQLIVSRSGRDTARIFGRTNVKAPAVRPAARDSLVSYLIKQVDGLSKVAQSGDVPSTYPLWDGVTQDGTGNIWIERSTWSGVPRQFDVFGVNGTFLGTVPAPFAGGRIASWNRDHVAVIDADADDLPRIRIYRIERRGH